MNATTIPYESHLPKNLEHEMGKRVEQALSWLSQSGIVIADARSPNYGAVYSFFDARKERYRLVYAEGTGYFLSFWKYLRATSRDSQLGGRALGAANWLLRGATEQGGFITMGIDDNVAIRQAFAFDNGICAKGLLDAYEVTNDPRYKEAARRVLDRLLLESLNDDGSVKPAIAVDSGEFLNSGRVWFTASGSFHAKISMPLIQLSALAEDQTYADAARTICAWTLRQQSTDGSFPANVTMRAVNLHAHCYATEALLYAYAALGTPAYRDAAERAVRWILDRQASNGSLKLWHGGRMLRRRASYAMAQSIRLFLLLYTLTHQEPLLQAATRTATFLRHMQAFSTDRRIDGGFCSEDISRSGILIRKNREVTSWATMFAIQAFDLLSKIRSLDFNQCLTWLF